MIPYYLVIVFAFIYYYYALRTNKEHSKVLFALFLLCLAIFVGIGDMQGGYDRYIYCELFDDTANTIRKGLSFRSSYIMGYESEFLYVYWNNIVAHVTENRYIFVLLTTLLMYVLYFKAFSTQMENYPAVTIVFLGLFYYFSHTYFRQSLAVGCAWWATKYIVDKKLVKFSILAIAAFFFHNSAVFFLPTFFLCRKQISDKAWYVILFIAFLLGFTPLASSLFAVFGDVTDTANRTASYVRDSQKDARWDYVFETFFFIFILAKSKMLFFEDKKYKVYCNMTFMFCAVILMFVRFGQGGRIGWPFMIGPIYILASIIQRTKITDTLRKIIILVSVALFVRLTIGWSGLLEPYKTFFTNGYPSAVLIYHKFEYDANYTVDKFYRKPIDIIWLQ